MNGQAAFILTAGIMAAFNPCGIAMLPSYIAYLLGGKKRRAIDGLWAGLFMTSGFLLVFLIVGSISMIFAYILGKVVAWIAFCIGILFLVSGSFMLFGKSGLSFHFGGNWKLKKESNVSLFLYGVAYALGSLGCTLPLFSVLILSSFHSTSGFANGMLNFFLYAIGMGLVVTTISFVSTLSQQMMIKFVRSSAKWMGKVSGVITLATGVYLVLYWIPFLPIHA
ncbi:hypothetical protein LSG31_01000 [Fodinisporobacter ferrooxydans]|uniref:Cytochrome C biogenesis protein transmembrane domain-containing protein n=1 Tax=Fodinisporobacter ferrooxydans TaxID=2901836 RepID=A0ABY4CK51_9BACL|nr:hypothetical protein LSG31_01000 [Alicyclobacillaceae bacterium MYW30-H2]